jgi:glycosyltransferase involved in cell wall biosynthesis
VPTFNRAPFLPATLDSLRAQTIVPTEVLVIDDGSTDETSEVLACYRDFVTVIRQENQGLAAARNKGLEAARGELVCFLDSDDLLPANSHERFIEALAASPEAAVAYSDVLLIDTNGNSLGLFSRYRPGVRCSGSMFTELAVHNLITPHAAMTRRRCIGETRFTQGVYGHEDWLFWLTLAAQFPFVYVNEPLAHYRIHRQSMSHANEQAMAESALIVQRRLFDFPRFQRLSARERARIYCSHGIKNAMVNRLEEAQQSFSKAVRIDPTYPVSYVLSFFALLGLRPLRYLIVTRRHVVGSLSWNEILAKRGT